MTRRVLFLAAILGLFQVAALGLKLGPVSPALYRERATPLTSFGSLHVGYVSGQHGAAFRSSWEPGPASRAPVRAPEPEVHDAMASELKRLPLKFLLEWLLYVSVSCCLLVGLPIALRRAPARPKASRPLAVAAVIWLTCGFFAVPLVFGYDASLYSTWEGPYPLSHSGSYIRLSHVPGQSISYRPLSEAVGLLPLQALEATVPPHLLPPMPWWVVFMVVVPIPYALTGLVASALALAVVQRRAAAHARRPGGTS